MGGIEIVLVASCYRSWDKLKPDGPFGLYTDLTLTFTSCHLLGNWLVFSVSARYDEERRLLLGRQEILNYLREKKRRALPSTSKRVSSITCQGVLSETSIFFKPFFSSMYQYKVWSTRFQPLFSETSLNLDLPKLSLYRNFSSLWIRN